MIFNTFIKSTDNYLLQKLSGQAVKVFKLTRDYHHITTISLTRQLSQNKNSNSRLISLKYNLQKQVSTKLLQVFAPILKRTSISLRAPCGISNYLWLSPPLNQYSSSQPSIKKAQPSGSITAILISNPISTYSFLKAPKSLDSWNPFLFCWFCWFCPFSALC